MIRTSLQALHDCRRPLTYLALFVLIFFILPVFLRSVLFVFDHSPKAYSYDDPTVDMSSTGLLPTAASYPAARVLIMSVPLSGKRGKFLSHSWVVFKRANADSWSRYDVLGFASRDADGAANGQWLGNAPTLNRYAPDGHWFGSRPVALADVEGAAAAAMIPKIEGVIASYEADTGHYRVWPGPNSNTFVEAVLRAVPELNASLPPTAIGKDFRPGAFVGLTDSCTGVEADLLGVLGLKIGWVEGVEINLFGLIAGLDPRTPALKLPAFGQINVGVFALLFGVVCATIAFVLLRTRATVTNSLAPNDETS
jgi:Protein of unknown function (DUF3750)